jgi:hypothetical protein
LSSVARHASNVEFIFDFGERSSGGQERLVERAEIVEALFGDVWAKVERSVLGGHDGDAATNEVFGV